MIPTELDVAIIGAGTTGPSAQAEVAKVNDRYRVFDPGSPWHGLRPERLHAVQGASEIRAWFLQTPSIR